MKRFFIFLLILALLLCGCKKEEAPTDIPGGSEPPEGVNWKNWEQYIPVTMTMGQETVDVLIGLDAIHLAVYYDKDEQELMGSITILTPLSDVDYSRMRLRVMDVNGDGYDDISIPDMLPSGDRIVDCWLWDSGASAFLYAPEYSKYQEDIGADISWQDGKQLISGVRDTPDGGENLLLWVDGQTIHIYRDSREEQLLTQVQIPEPLSQEALEELSTRSFWELRDKNGDRWGDLQLPYLWEQTETDVFVYAYCWIWQPDSGAFQLDKARSEMPTI